MSGIFFELLSEEVPYWLQKNAIEQIKKKIIELVVENNLSLSEEVKIFAEYTTLRLIIKCDNLIYEQKSSIEEIKGPPLDAPDKAIEGFLKKFQVSKETLIKKEINNKGYFFIKKKIKGKRTEEIFKDNLEKIIININWQKSMKWRHEYFKWGRPIKNILLFFDNKFVPLNFLEKYSINNNSFSMSHKKIEKEIKFKNYDEYKRKLLSSKVIIDQTKREEKIKKEITNFCKKNNILLKNNHIPLISLNAGLTEYPDILFGKINNKYMSLPQEILEVVMINDQNFIPLFNKNNSLSPYFVIIVDFVEKKFQKNVIFDNEKVLEARFDDASFYWHTDLKISLDSRKKLLSDIQFHQKLGTIEDKIKRMEFFASNLASQFNLKIDKENLSQAIKLSKLDLTTGLVREFPELQGIIGGYIAQKEKNNKNVCLSLKEQYLPKGPNDLCPKNDLSIILSLSDKLDTLLGFFLIDEMPSSSKDPFALRRSALGILRIIIENNLIINLENFFNDNIIKKYNLRSIDKINIKDLTNFLIERFKFFLKSITTRQDIVNAFFSEKFFNSDFLILYKKFIALNEFVINGQGKRIIELNKRALNIVTIEKKKTNIPNMINKDLLENNYEIILVKELNNIKNKLNNKDSNFKDVLTEISNFDKSLNNFFDNVMVNVDNTEIKNNRLSILNNVLNTLKKYADFSKIQK